MSAYRSELFACGLMTHVLSSTYRSDQQRDESEGVGENENEDEDTDTEKTAQSDGNVDTDSSSPPERGDRELDHQKYRFK